MSGMLQHNDAYRERAQGRQAEARKWAEIDHLARLSRANRIESIRRRHHQGHHHSARLWLRAWRMHLHELVSPRHLRPHH